MTFGQLPIGHYLAPIFRVVIYECQCGFRTEDQPDIGDECPNCKAEWCEVTDNG